MKVTSAPIKFNPINLVIESETELVNLLRVFQWIVHMSNNLSLDQQNLAIKTLALLQLQVPRKEL